MPALLPPCLTIKALSYSNCQRSTDSISKWIFRNLAYHCSFCGTIGGGICACLPICVLSNPCWKIKMAVCYHHTNCNWTLCLICWSARFWEENYMHAMSQNVIIETRHQQKQNSTHSQINLHNSVCHAKEALMYRPFPHCAINTHISLF